ncbi:MAG: pyruvate, phosphate dikinase [Candidatus Eisenbacteria bacterium]|nr:pyruvate, phosphate dikinase [Candidatus Eisenbacteria bacterium]
MEGNRVHPESSTKNGPRSGRSADASEKLVYSFGLHRTEGSGEMRDLLGGKGAGLAEMTRAGIPVPPGFTITTQVCNMFYALGGQLPDAYRDQHREALERLEQDQGRQLGDPVDPLLVSVRSGAKYSMPGMMDTILNLGLNDASVEGLARKTGNPRFAYDSYRRFLQMFGSVVLSIPKRLFEERMDALKSGRGVQLDLELSAEDMHKLAEQFKALIEQRTNEPFPQDPHAQLDRARDAVFRSWFNDRAVFYRRQHGIADDLGTAVNVQAMVFGNLGEDSATGVGFTRNPATGERQLYGEYLRNAQGEDIVAGIRTPRPIREMERDMPQVHAELRDITQRLERHYRDVQDFEFTVQEGRLFMLQTRTGKRTAQAAVKIAVEMVGEKLIAQEEALLRVDPGSLHQLLLPRFDPEAKFDPLTRGLGASPGAAVGRIVFDPDDAVTLVTPTRENPHPDSVILVRGETSPDDIHGMAAASGILTARGGMTSHAAVVARGMGKSCVTGCSEAEVDEEAGILRIGKTVLERGDFISIDGSSGDVIEGEVPTVAPEIADEFRVFMEWADARRQLRVRTNADAPEEATTARRFGAEGIGLCRTEHMFFQKDRLPVVQEMILLAPQVKRIQTQLAQRERELENAAGEARTALEEEIARLREALARPRARYDEVLAQILPFQRDDFYGIFRAMDGLPVTIRTLDPPLHEFLPKKNELEVEVALLRERGSDPDRLAEREALLARVTELSEQNPMLGHRGCRLGVAYPEITALQVRAIMEAAARLIGEGGQVFPEIMIPLVGTPQELAHQRRIAERVAKEVIEETGVDVPHAIGTMIEVPRAALLADRIAEQADFFSFGTNDLTQMTFGYSRDDSGRFLPDYVASGILPQDPFVVLDREGVGQLVRVAVERARAVKPQLKTGICGVHGGNPSSIEFCHQLGLDYVSCVPFEVPIARLAAAQATVQPGDSSAPAGHRGQI